MKTLIHKIKQTLLNYLVHIFIILFLLVLAGSITYIVRLKQSNNRLTTAMVRQSSDFERRLNSREERIFFQNQKILTYQEAIRTRDLDIDQLKANNMRHVQAQIRLKEQISNQQQIIANFQPDVEIQYVDVPGSPDPEHYMKLPAIFSYKDPFLNFDATIQYPIGLTFDPGDITLTSYPIITIGHRNKHESAFRNFFSRPEAVVMYENANPYVEVVEMDNVIIKEQTRWYRQWWFWATIGFGAGIIISN